MEDVDFVPIAARNLPRRLQSDSSSRLRRPVWRAASDTDIPATTVTGAIRMAAIRDRYPGSNYPGSGYGNSTVRCESKDRRTRHCNIDTRGGEIGRAHV